MTDQEFQPHVCVECGATEPNHYYEEVAARLSERSLCFSCDFWFERIERHVTDETSAIIEGNAYIANPLVENPWNKSILGCGGAFCRIAWDDGRTTETNDLWCQGQVPERFRERLPDNARFVHEVAAQHV